jgi:hypothetical protein
VKPLIQGFTARASVTGEEGVIDGGHTSAIVPAPRDVWLSVLSSDPDALPSQTPDWMDAMCAGGWWRDASRLYVTRSGRRIILPMVRLGVEPLACLTSPRHGWGYGGLIADDGVSPSDVALVSNDLKSTRKFSLWIRPNPLHAKAWGERFSAGGQRIPKMSHIVDLEGGEAAVRARFNGSAIKGIKTAEKMKVRIETQSGEALLPVYFDLAVKSWAFWARRQNEPTWMGKLRGSFRDSECKWTGIAKHLGEAFQVSIAWRGEQPVASGIVLQGRNSHGVRAAMDPEARSLGASHLLNWVVLQNACAHGSQWFHMGESATSGAAEFKRSFGAKAFSFEEFRFEQVPLSRADAALRNVVKKLIGFREDCPNAAKDNREGMT